MFAAKARPTMMKLLSKSLAPVRKSLTQMVQKKTFVGHVEITGITWL